MQTHWTFTLNEFRCKKCRRIYAIEADEGSGCPFCARDEAVRSIDSVRRHIDSLTSDIVDLRRPNASLRGVIARMKGKP